MKIIINNPLALNKLQGLKLIYPLFSLNIEFYSEPELACYLDSATSGVYDDLCENKQITELDYTSEEMTTINEWCRCFTRLSRFEVLSLYLAKREAAGIFATHRLLQESAESLDIPVYGYNWLFNQLSHHQVFHSMDIFNKWKDLETQLCSFTDSTRPECVQRFYYSRPEMMSQQIKLNRSRQVEMALKPIRIQDERA